MRAKEKMEKGREGEKVRVKEGHKMIEGDKKDEKSRRKREEEKERGEGKKLKRGVICFNPLQTIKHGMKTGFAAMHNDMFGFTADLFAKHLPITLMRFGQHQYQSGSRIKASEIIECMH